MRPKVMQRAIVALVVIAGLYLCARALGWTGPNPRVELEPRLLYPAIVIVSAWGIARLTRGNRGVGGNAR